MRNGRKAHNIKRCIHKFSRMYCIRKKEIPIFREKALQAQKKTRNIKFETLKYVLILQNIIEI